MVHLVKHRTGEMVVAKPYIETVHLFLTGNRSRGMVRPPRQQTQHGVGTVEVSVQRVGPSRPMEQTDVLAVEEPLEIRLEYMKKGKREAQSVSVTMRTPGQDVDLALGFLFSEGIIQHRKEITSTAQTGPSNCRDGKRNVVTVELSSDVVFDAQRLERHFYTTSSCGVCGKTSLEALKLARQPQLPDAQPLIDASIVHALPVTLRVRQDVFSKTGGLHAAALFDAKGAICCIREDVGRHNALDKLIGEQFRNDALPLHQGVLLVSGRASFELVQKALMAEVAIMAAVGAPSSLAVDLARQHGMTLLGFVRDGRFNVYSGARRIKGLTQKSTPSIHEFPFLIDLLEE